MYLLHGSFHLLPVLWGSMPAPVKVAAASSEAADHFPSTSTYRTSIFFHRFLRKHHLPPALLEVPARHPDPTRICPHFPPYSHLVVQKYITKVAAASVEATDYLHILPPTVRSSTFINFLYGSIIYNRLYRKYPLGTLISPGPDSVWHPTPTYSSGVEI